MITCCVCLLEPGEGFIKASLSCTPAPQHFPEQIAAMTSKRIFDSLAGKKKTFQCGASQFTVARLPHASPMRTNHSPIVILFAVDEAVSRVAAQLGVEVLRAPTAAEAGDVPGLVGGEEVVAVILNVQLVRLMRQQLSFNGTLPISN